MKASKEGSMMDIKEITEKVDSLKSEVQSHTHSYIVDPDCTYVIDNQLNGYVRAVQAYCATNNLTAIAANINDLIPIERLPIKSQGIEWKKGMVKKSIGNRAAGKEERLQCGKG